MHIPDGYLSPATCAVAYAASVPFWRIALKRVKKAMNARQVPLLSLFAALSFVIMMFNLPLPGGTTGHATGIGLATVVIGPWAAMLAVSVALIVQALFFGDGGVTAIGANCFNMAIAGSLVAYAVYRLVAGRSALASARRVVAAGIAGYLAINVSALLAAVEFGIQPMLYKDAAGAPLYCPYPLNIAIPAMMIGHLTIAAGNIRDTGQALPQASKRPLRPLWAGLAILLVLTPLGILAAGSAWGEWMASDYANPAVRREIALASLHHAAPQRAPQGMQKLSSIWTAPFARYAPPYIRGAAFGYLLSAMFGAGLIVVVVLLVGRS
jgi:cobalt/nickel transport system permease protein